MVRTRRRSPSSAVGGRRTGSRLRGDQGNDRWSSVPMSMTEQDATVRSTNYTARSPALAGPELEPPLVDHAGVHQNITFRAPGPVSDMHCWHQKVTVTPPAKATATATSTPTKAVADRSTASCSHSPAPHAVSAVARCGCFASSSRAATSTAGRRRANRAHPLLPRGQARSRWQSCSTGHHASGLSYPSRHERTRRLAGRCFASCGAASRRERPRPG